MEEVLKVKKVHLDPLDSKRIQRVGEVIDQAYLEKLHTLQITSPPAPLQIIYTNLHGTGIRIIPQALKSWGYNDVALVKAQSTPDGHFTHAPSPNPEEEKALKMGTDLLLKEQKDLLIATDPDADRVGIVIRHQNQPIRFTGHQIGSLCLNHICSSLQEKGRLPPFSIAIKTIVTTELFQKIARQYGVKCIDVLTGFKYIAQTIADLERVEPTSTFLFGAEESYGYLAGTFVRDKDAISTSCLIAEMTSKAKSQNKTLFNLLYELYEIHGVHREHLTNIKFADTQQGMRQMEQCIDRIRKEPPSLIGDTQVDHFEDYALAPVSHTHASKDGQSVTSDLPQECEKWGLKMGTLPQSNVLRFWLKDQTKIVIRPSGTEPKVKIYIEVVTTKGLPINQGIKACDEKLKYLEGIMNSFLSLGT
jgi:phosphoglucomutase/phosphomannomutase